jgi:hypothetical protein
MTDKNLDIRHWLESSGIKTCSTCGAKAMFVPYGGHPLARKWYRLAKGEMLMCCPNGCLEGSLPLPRKIRRFKL